MVHSSDWDLSLPGNMPESSQRVIRSMMLNTTHSVELNRPPSRLDGQIPVMLGNSRKKRGHEFTRNVSKGGFTFTSESYGSSGDVIMVNVQCGHGREPYQISIRIVRRGPRDEFAPQFFGAVYICPQAAALIN